MTRAKRIALTFLIWFAVIWIVYVVCTTSMPETLITILIGVSVALFALVLYYVVSKMVRRRIEDRMRARISPMVMLALLLGSIWSLRLAVGLFGLIHPELSTIVADSSLASLTGGEELFNSLIHALQTFSMDEDYTAYMISGKAMVHELYGVNEDGQSWFGIYASLLNLLAPVAGGAIILDIIASFVPKLRLAIYRLAFWKDKYYFSELNEGSLALAKNYMYIDKEELRKRLPKMPGFSNFIVNMATLGKSFFLPTIVFTDIDDSDDEKEAEMLTEARLLGAICIKDDLSHIKVNEWGKKKFFLIDEDEEENLKAFTALTDPANSFIKKSEIFLFVNSDAYVQIERNVRDKLINSWNLNNDKAEDSEQLPTVFPVRCYRNLVSNLLCDVPLYEPLIGKKKNADGTVDLTVTILGGGDIGTEMLLTTYWMGQMLKCNLKINVISMETEEEFWNKIDYVNPEIRHTTLDNDPILRINQRGDMADVYCHVEYYQCDIKSAKFISYLHQRDANIVNTDYFFVCLGSDKDNISVANTVKSYIGEYHLSGAYRKNNEERINEAKEKNNDGSVGPHTVITYVVYDVSLANSLNVEYETKDGKIEDAKQIKSDGKTVDIYMRAVGNLEEVYSVDNVTLECHKRFAERIYEAYVEAQQRSGGFGEISEKLKKRPNDDYNFWADVAREMHVQYKLYSAREITRSSVIGDHDRKVLAAESIERIYNRFAEKLPVRKKNDEAQEFDPKKKETDPELILLHELAWLEHRRWNAFTRVKGFRCTDDYKDYANNYIEKCKEENKKVKGVYKQMEIGLHPCLRECDKKGIRGNLVMEEDESKCNFAVKELWKVDDDAYLDLLDKLSYDLHCDEYNGYDFKEYDYLLEDLKKLMEEQKNV